MHQLLRLRRTGFALAAILLTGAITAGCSSAPAGSGSPTDGPIKIGYAVALTGPNNAWDGPILAGAGLAVDDINKAGGVDGRKLELIKVDNASSMEKTASAALQALEQGADILVPSCDYNFGSPAARAAQDKGHLVVGCAGDQLFGKTGIGPLVFNVDPLTTQIEGASMANFAWQKGLRKVFMFKDTTIDYSKNVCRDFLATWKALGGQVSGEVSFANSDASIQSQVSELAAKPDADVIAMCSFLPGVSSAVKQIRARGIDLPIVSDGGSDGNSWLSAVPGLSNFYNNSVGSLSGDDDFDDLTGIGQRYQALYGEKPATDYGPIFGYSEIQLIVEAIKAADGSLDGATLAKAIEKFSGTKLATGVATFTPDCHIARIEGVGIREVQDGKPKFVGRFPVDNAPKSAC